MALLQLKDPLELFVKRREFFLVPVVESDINAISSLLPACLLGSSVLLYAFNFISFDPS